MPCGGIYPVTNGAGTQPDTCFYCNEALPTKEGEQCLFVEEWDCFIHDACCPAFMETLEGKIITTHGHSIERLAQFPALTGDKQQGGAGR